VTTSQTLTTAQRSALFRELDTRELALIAVRIATGQHPQMFDAELTARQIDMARGRQATATNTRVAELPTTAGDLLEVAAAHMLKVGHHPEAFVDPVYHGDFTAAPCCALGAIRISAGLAPDEMEREHDDQPPMVREAEEAVAALIIRTTGAGCTDPATGCTDAQETIATWSDDGNDAESIAALLSDAADLARRTA
jgi:hypothetical protein